MKRGKSYEGDHIRTLTSNSRGTCGNASGGAYCPGRGCGTYGCSTGEISGKSGGCSPDAGFLKGTKTSREVLNFLKQLNEEGNTIVMITHDNSIAMEAKRVVRIADGHKIFDGDVKDYAAIL